MSEIDPLHVNAKSSNRRRSQSIKTEDFFKFISVATQLNGDWKELPEMGECITVECRLVFKKANLNKIIISQFPKGRRFQWKKFLIVMQNFISFRGSSQTVIKKSFVTRTKKSHTLRLTSKDEKFVDGVVCWAVKQKLTSIDASLLITRQPLHFFTARLRRKSNFQTFAIMNGTNEQKKSLEKSISRLFAQEFDTFTYAALKMTYLLPTLTWCPDKD